MPSLRERLRTHALWLEKNLDYMEQEQWILVEVDAVLAAAEAWAQAERALKGVPLFTGSQTPAEMALADRRREAYGALLALLPTPEVPEL